METTTAAPPAADPITLNKRELAAAFKVSEPTIDKWLAEGCPVVRGGQHGVAYQFDPKAVLAWRQDLEAQAEKEAQAKQEMLRGLELDLTGGSVADDEIQRLPARERGLALEAERKALLLAKEKGELVDRAEVVRDYQAVFGLLRQRLLSMPGLLRRTAQLSPDASRAVDTEMRALLRELHLQIQDPHLRDDVTVETADAA